MEIIQVSCQFVATIYPNLAIYFHILWNMDYYYFLFFSIRCINAARDLSPCGTGSLSAQPTWAMTCFGLKKWFAALTFLLLNMSHHILNICCASAVTCYSVTAVYAKVCCLLSHPNCKAIHPSQSSGRSSRASRLTSSYSSSSFSSSLHGFPAVLRYGWWVLD